MVVINTVSDAVLRMDVSQLQSMVSELKTGFSSALMELSQIQLGDTFLREELEENRKSCHKKAQRLETLVEALKVRHKSNQSHSSKFTDYT